MANRLIVNAAVTTSVVSALRAASKLIGFPERSPGLNSGDDLVDGAFADFAGSCSTARRKVGDKTGAVSSSTAAALEAFDQLDKRLAAAVTKKS